MARPIWKGNISFGLVYIPVSLCSAEKPSSELHFHLLDKRNHNRVRYERVNVSTGKEVPWEEIEKAYEFEKGNYVVVDQKELEKTAYENSQTVELENFVDKDAVNSLYYIKPYYLIPTKQGEKGYVLLRETLERTKKIGIAKVVIRTRQHLAAIIPYKNVLVLNLIRFSNEVRDIDEFSIPTGDLKSYKVSPKEIEMAEKLIKSMSLKWNPKKYRDENRELLHKWIQHKVKHGKAVSTGETAEESKPRKTKKTAEVIDFMSLLKKSIENKDIKKRRPQKPRRITPHRRKSAGGASNKVKKKA